MKIYVLDKSVVFAGKAWEIRHKLKELQNQHIFVTDWIENVHARPAEASLVNEHPTKLNSL
ncbi:Z-ring formation inhibitor MciZ [Actinomycetes bacterium NPDC127524]